jgi:hypothetical protein
MDNSRRFLTELLIESCAMPILAVLFKKQANSQKNGTNIEKLSLGRRKYSRSSRAPKRSKEWPF